MKHNKVEKIERTERIYTLSKVDIIAKYLITWKSNMIIKRLNARQKVCSKFNYNFYPWQYCYIKQDQTHLEYGNEYFFKYEYLFN